MGAVGEPIATQFLGWVRESDLPDPEDLLADPKERAEHAMLVDLARNDIGRVCEADSIEVRALMDVEYYSHVMHLSSTVTGVLRDGLDCWDALQRSLPVGTVSGAPKVRAMEIIAELEPTVRGPYCGSLFYAGFNGAFDSSILIRTFVLRHGMVQCKAGGGIVAQSDPLAEYEETLHKAAGMLRVFE